MEFYTPLSNPDGYKKRLSVCTGRSVCREPDDAFAQGLSSLRSALHVGRGLRARAAAGQCPAPIPGFPAPSAGDPGGQKAVIERAGVQSKSWRRHTRAGRSGAAWIFGEGFVGPPAAARVPPRQQMCSSGEIVQAALMPAKQAFRRRAFEWCRQVAEWGT